MTTEWTIAITGALSAHFKQADGPSRPGTDWAVDLMGPGSFKVLIRTYPHPSLPARLKHNTDYQGAAVLIYVQQLLHDGWDPATYTFDQAQSLAITIGPPSADQQPTFERLS